MSTLLRHKAETQGVAIRPDGYVLMDDLIAWLGKKHKNINLSAVMQVVDDNNKKRFEVSTIDNQLMIRAVQGHTMKKIESEQLLTKITEPFHVASAVVHGTYHEPLPLIMKGGLNRMARNHIHMAIGMPNSKSVVSGMRTSCQVVVEVNMPKAIYGQHQIPFYISTNKVILSEGLKDGSLPVEYFRSVIDIQKGMYLYQAPFEYICVFDFQFQCADKDQPEFQLDFNEIIEFAVVVIDVKQQKVVAEFQTCVKPVLDPKLTQFCTSKTGITQEQVDEGVTLEEALKKVHEWLFEQGLFGTEFVFASRGDFNGNQIYREAIKKDINLPCYLTRWISLKRAFPQSMLGSSQPEYNWDDVKTAQVCKPVVKGFGIYDMLNACKLELEGKEHSAIDNARNLARCVIEVLNQKHTFKQGMVRKSTE